MTMQEEIQELQVELAAWRERLVRGLLRASLVVGALALVAGLINAVTARAVLLVVIYVAAYLAMLVITFASRLPYLLRAGVFLFLLYGLGLVGLLESGLSGDGRVFLITFPIVATALLGQRAGMVSLGLSLVTLIGVGWGMTTGLLDISVEQMANSTDPTAWFSGSVVFLLLALAMLIPTAHLLRGQVFAAQFARQNRALQEAQAALAEVHRQQEEANERLRQALEESAQRAGQLQVITELSHAIAQIRDLDRLLSEVTHLIADHLGFYHVGIFLLDESGRYAVLQAANSEGGQRMLARGHKLEVGVQGIVGYVTGTGRPRIALDVGADAVHFDNPDLPETRSEVALPLRIGEEVIGALDVQSKETAAFTQMDVVVLQMLADHVAIAIENARLLRRVQEALQEAREAQRRYVEREWSLYLRRRPHLEAAYVPMAAPSEPPPRTAIEEALRKGEMVALSGDGRPAFLAVPIKLRGQVIGVIDLQTAEEGRPWTEDEIALVRAISDQMALALENVQLFEQTVRRAEREHLVTQISGKIRASTNLEAIVQTAAQELARALGTSRVLVRLGVEEDGKQGVEG